MPVNFEFHRMSEKKPKNGEDIIFLASNSIYDFQGYEVVQATVEYTWIVLDDENNDTGQQICYTEGEFAIGCKLVIIVNGFETCDDNLWMYPEDFFKAMGFDGKFDPEYGMFTEE